MHLWGYYILGSENSYSLLFGKGSSVNDSLLVLGNVG